MTGKSPTTEWPGSDEKLAEMILHVSAKCQSDNNFGATKLNKLLFFADFLSYQQRGVPITGAAYMKLDHGPVPHRLKPVRDSLIKKKAAALGETPLGRFKQHRLVPLRKANLSQFSGEDIDFVDEVISMFRNMNGSEISEISHDRIWRVAKDKEKIPYEAAFVSDENAAKAEVDFAKVNLPEYFPKK